MSITTTYPYNSGTSFSYDATKIAFSGSKAQLLDNRLPNSIFYASLRQSVNADWNGVTGTLVGDATIINNSLNCLDSTTANGANWPVSLGAKGAVRFTIATNYTGIPPNTRYFLTAFNTLASSKGAIDIFNDFDGNMYADIFADDGSRISRCIGAFSPVSGVPIEVEYNWDTVLGTYTLLAGGTVIAQITATTGTRTTAATLALGTDINGMHGAGATFNYLLAFSLPQHTANYTPATPPPVTIYAIDNPTVTTNSPVTLDQLLSFTATYAASGSDGITFQLQISGQNKWWNGTAWANSNGTYAQSNIPADIQANAAALGTTINGAMYVVVLLHSANGNTTPSVTSATIIYDFFGLEPVGPNVCTVWGYLADASGNPLSGATVNVQVPSTYGNQGIFISAGTYATTTSVNGYFSIDLRESTTPNVPYTFSIIYGKTTQFLGKALIPNSVSQNMATLSFM